MKAFLVDTEEMDEEWAVVISTRGSLVNVWEMGIETIVILGHRSKFNKKTSTKENVGTNVESGIAMLYKHFCKQRRNLAVLRKREYEPTRQHHRLLLCVHPRKLSADVRAHHAVFMATNGDALSCTGRKA